MIATELAEAEASCDRLRSAYDDVRALNAQLAVNHAEIVAAKDARIAELENYNKVHVAAARLHIEQLADRDRQIAALREALEPFAAMADKFKELDVYYNTDVLIPLGDSTITVGHFRKAHAALEQAQP
jgi:hypothetical protein